LAIRCLLNVHSDNVSRLAYIRNCKISVTHATDFPATVIAIHYIILNDQYVKNFSTAIHALESCQGGQQAAAELIVCAQDGTRLNRLSRRAPALRDAPFSGPVTAANMLA
jgi:hypothetical protein